MKTKMVSDIINDHIKKFNELSEELNSSYDQISSSACIRRIGIKRDFTTEYECIVAMLKIAYALDDCDTYEFSKSYDELFEKYRSTFYGI